ncbi:MAG: YlxR family protein [Akkermansiaceae bacterium]|nr:YlxR family protein [Armatimonadota bacterium]
MTNKGTGNGEAGTGEESPPFVPRSSPPIPPRPAKRTPIRTCVACRTPGGKRGLIRVVRLPDATGVVLDPTGKRSGRGAYVCATVECVNNARKRKAFERSLKVAVTDDVFFALQNAVAEKAENEKGATTMS